MNLRKYEKIAIVSVIVFLFVVACVIGASLFALIATMPDMVDDAVPAAVQTVERPKPTLTAKTREPIVLLHETENGERTFPVSIPETGAYFLGVHYTGTRWFAVTVMDAKGNPVASPVNSTDGYEGQQMIRLKRGNYYFQVETNDNDSLYLIVLMY